MHQTINLSAWRLNPDAAILREPPRPPAYRGPSYEQSFDFTTVFCDAFWSADSRRIVLIGPPLLNLEHELDFSFVSKPSNAVCEYKVHHCISVDRIEVAAPPGTDHLLIRTIFGEFELTPQPNLEDLFRGKRVILTKSKNNDLAWIHDWVLFHQRNHGCNGVLIYDTGSTRYAWQEIDEALSTIDGLDQVVVIDWPFPWGPADGAKDSKFSQMVILEHARFRLLSAAKSVLQGDVDELVLTEGPESVFELVERSAGGYLRYGGRWVEAIKGVGNGEADDGGSIPRHGEFHHVRKDGDAGRKVGTKWSCVPAKIRPDAQWTVNWVALDPSPRDQKLASSISLRHFKAINTGWRVQPRPESDRFDPELHHADQRLRQTLDYALDGRSGSPVSKTRDAHDVVEPADPPSKAETEVDDWRVLEALAFRDRSTSYDEKRQIALELLRQRPDQPRLWNQFASLQQRNGDVPGAISSLRRAIALDPTFALVYTTLGSLLARQGKIEDAIKAIESAVDLDPKNFIGHQQLSQLYAEQGRIDDAIGAARKALDLRPNDPGLHHRIGNLLEQQGVVDEAVESQLAAVALGMAGPGMHRKLAVLFARQYRPGKAMKCGFGAAIGYWRRLVGDLAG